MKKLSTLLLIMGFCSMGYSQETNDEFKSFGQPFVKVFTNFHNSSTNGNPHNAFEIQRAYFGYGYNLSKNFSGKVSIDVGDPGVGKLKMTAYLKNAYFQYKSGNLTTKFGLIGLSQFKMQEKQWGGRYLYKSFQDQHKFGNSADLAIFTSFKINGMLSADITISNGEGYKSVETDSILKYSGGITIKPIDGLDIRVYYDYMGSDSAQQTISFYTGYTIEKLKVGAEYNQQMNHKMAKDENFSGLSFYGRYKLKKISVFGRFDQLTSVTLSGDTDAWNYGKDGQALIAGIELSPVKGIKITPNYQLWMPANSSPSVNTIYISCEIKF